MRIDNNRMLSCSCRQLSLPTESESVDHSPPDPLRSFGHSAGRPRGYHNAPKRSLSTLDLPVSQQRPQRHKISSDPDRVPADGHFPSGRRRCRSLDCLCMRKTLVAMATGWLRGYQSVRQEEMTASDEDISVDSAAMASTSSEPPKEQHQHHQHQNRVCTSLSWDSGYNEYAADAFSAIENQRPAITMRMPSVVISDCSDDPNEQADNVIPVNGYHRLSELSSPTLSSHSSSGVEMDSADNASASWSWSSSSYRDRSNSCFLILPGQSSSDDDAVVSSNLLSVRRLSDCSSCSSLATLDMEPCCPGLCSAQEPVTSFQADPHQPFRLDFGVVSDAAEEETEPNLNDKSEEVPSPTEECNNTSCSSTKVSAWRKVRSAVQWSPFVQTFRRQRYPWVQLAGHQGNFKLGGERGTILKKLCPKEESCFQQLMNDPLRSFIPSYKGSVTSDDGEKFLVLEDLLGDFRNPSVMDCKLGVRTYLEDELAKAKLKPKLRKDMFEKMLQVDPNAPTPEELQLKGVTKPRYMVWRETISSTANLGFRIEGIRKQDGTSSKDFKTVGSADQILEVLKEFTQQHPKALVQYIERLTKLAETLARSEFFATHELIGTSLLFVHDESKANVWMIDFAKTHRLPPGVVIDHRTQWRVGNHEDGYLIGLANLTQLLEKLSLDKNRNHSSNKT